MGCSLWVPHCVARTCLNLHGPRPLPPDQPGPVPPAALDAAREPRGTVSRPAGLPPFRAGSDDPADPQLLAADRLLAAASQRAAAMAKALDAAKAQRLLGDGGAGGGH